MGVAIVGRARQCSMCWLLLVANRTSNCHVLLQDGTPAVHLKGGGG